MNLALAVFAVAPLALGGVRLRGPAGPQRLAWLEALRDLLPPQMPWRPLPLHASDDALHGGLDLAATLAAGRPVRQRGLLAQAEGGIVIAAMAERLSAPRAAQLCSALDDGARLAVVALDEGQGEDEAAPSALVERLALCVEPPRGGIEVDAAAVAAAREGWRAVEVSDELIEALAGTAQALGVDSARATWQSLCVLRIVAALQGCEQAGAEHASAAAQLVLAPRATRLPPQPEDAPQDAPPEPPQEGAEAASDDPSTSEPGDPDDEQAAPDRALDEQLIEAAAAAIPPGLLAMLASGGPRQSGRGAAGRAGQTARSQQQGRPIGATRGEPRRGARLALIDTLRAAAPWQRLRRQVSGESRLLVTRDDLRVTRRLQKRATTTIFAIDASGSQALHRLAEAKGAVELLLADCYARRDRVAVVGFRGTAAQVLLAPTRSLVRAKRELAGLPGGGGTPLAAGIDAARLLAEAARRGGATPLVVLLTDGRANIGRDGTPGRQAATEDALAAARALRASGVACLLIDTSAQTSPAAQTLAVQLQARCIFLPHAQAQRVSQVVREERDRG